MRIAVVTIRGPLARSEAGSLLDHAAALIRSSRCEVLCCEVSGAEPDLLVVDVLAHVALITQRAGCALRLLGASDELRALMSLMGLAGVLETRS